MRNYLGNAKTTATTRILSSMLLLCVLGYLWTGFVRCSKLKNRERGTVYNFCSERVYIYIYKY